MKAIPTEQYAFKVILTYGESDTKAQIIARRLKWEGGRKNISKNIESLTTIYHLLKCGA
ncbi:MAG: hypothetical protein VSS75_034580 [Candidatus Parabeggiatoa sp.]|nr:hypothetical protein [Candidatus Parabeggiatoa sp.]